MAERWSKLRKRRAEELRDEGATVTAIATAIGLPEHTVAEYLAKLSGKGTSPKKGPSKETSRETPVSKQEAARTAARRTKTPKKAKGPRTVKERTEELLASANTRFGVGTLQRAAELEVDYYLRRPTGILSLDIGLGGGWPASSLCMITGPDGAGKDYLILRTLAEQQRIYGEQCNLLVYFTEFAIDKQFARDMCGLKIAMTDTELDVLDRSRREKGDVPLSQEERARYQEQIGEILVIPPDVVADDALDVVLDAVNANIYQVVVINSLGVLLTAAKDSKDSLREFAQQSNEAVLLTKFMGELPRALNGVDEAGSRKHTLVLVANQVRAKRDMPRTRPGFRVSEKQKYQSGSRAHSMSHGKAIELMVHKGMQYLDKEVKPPQALGRELEWELLKGKLGTHDGVKGTYTFWYDGGADVLEDLVNTAVRLEVIEQSGTWYRYTPLGEQVAIQAQGQAGLRQILRESPKRIENLRQQCFLVSGIDCVYREDDGPT